MSLTPQHKLVIDRSVPHLAGAAAISGLFSIAICHSLIGITLAAILLSKYRLRMPDLWKPLAAFALFTVISLALSPNPAEGLPQIRKFYVFLLLPIAYSAIQPYRRVRRVILVMLGVGALSSLWSLVQFVLKFRRAAAAGQPFYQSYIAERTTGFMSHWMTFAGQMLIILMLLGAFLFFAKYGRGLLVAGVAAGAAVSIGLVLNFTRSYWPAAAAGGIFLIWFWRRWVVTLIPVVLAAGFLAAPGAVQQRVRSAWNPDPTLDSNQHREVLRQTGMNMIRAHPFFGVGPEQVKHRFHEFLPGTAPRPVPANWYYNRLHNVYVDYAAERGVPAMLALLAFLLMILHDMRRALRATMRGEERRFLFFGCIAVTMGLMIAGVWEVNLGDSDVLGLFLAVVGCAYAARDFPECDLV